MQAEDKRLHMSALTDRNDSIKSQNRTGWDRVGHGQSHRSRHVDGSEATRISSQNSETDNGDTAII